MTTVAIPNISTIVGTDATVLSIANIAAGAGTVGTPESFLACFETAEMTLKRDFVDTTSANDAYNSQRPIRFGKGSLTLSNFVRGTSNAAASFAAGAFFQISFTEAVDGDAITVIGALTEYKKSVGKEATKDSVTFDIVGEPLWGAGDPGTSAGTPASINLD
jgi:hypothetical protein